MTRDEVVSLVVQHGTGDVTRQAMNEAIAVANEHCAKGARVKHLAQSSSATATLLTFVFEYPV